MQVVPFLADSAADALEQIRRQLGPEAVVLNVRQLPGAGLSRLWQKPRIEVLACCPAAKTADPSRDSRGEIPEAKETLPEKERAAKETEEIPLPIVAVNPGVDGGWRAGKILETMGVLPLLAQRVVEQMRKHFGANPPDSLGEELAMMRAALMQLWKQAARVKGPQTHVLVGPSGVGKTTCLCKWLTQAVLLEERSAQVFRLDGRIANTAESLSVHCEILNVPLERAGSDPSSRPEAELVLIDLPGVDWRDTAAVHDLGQRLEALPGAQMHLVLNAAYETPMLLAQLRAFEALPVADLIFTHLDEELRWGKLWNFVLGTDYALRFFSAGQNIPGDFCEATPEKLLARQFPRK